jgi:hypothetical protein
MAARAAIQEGRHSAAPSVPRVLFPLVLPRVKSKLDGYGFSRALEGVPALAERTAGPSTTLPRGSCRALWSWDVHATCLLQGQVFLAEALAHRQNRHRPELRRSAVEGPAVLSAG